MIGNMRFVLAVFTVSMCLPAGCSQHSEEVGLEPRVETPSGNADKEETEVVEERWPDGKLRLRKHVLRKPDGTLVNHGLYERWHDNGRKEYEALFVHGKTQGTTTRWHKNGEVWTQQEFLDGKPHGPGYIWDESGNMRKEENYADGRPHGTWTVWDKHGRIKCQHTYEHGNPAPAKSRANPAVTTTNPTRQRPAPANPVDH